MSTGVKVRYLFVYLLDFVLIENFLPCICNILTDTSKQEKQEKEVKVTKLQAYWSHFQNNATTFLLLNFLSSPVFCLFSHVYCALRPSLVSGDSSMRLLSCEGQSSLPHLCEIAFVAASNNTFTRCPSFLHFLNIVELLLRFVFDQFGVLLDF